jgi:hypothetical protein
LLGGFEIINQHPGEGIRRNVHFKFGENFQWPAQSISRKLHEVIAKVMKFRLEILPTHYFYREKAA